MQDRLGGVLHDLATIGRLALMSLVSIAVFCVTLVVTLYLAFLAVHVVFG